MKQDGVRFVYNRPAKRTLAFWGDRLVGFWEAGGFLLGCRCGTILRPREPGKVDVVDMNAWSKVVWKTKVQEFVEGEATK